MMWDESKKKKKEGARVYVSLALCQEEIYNYSGDVAS